MVAAAQAGDERAFATIVERYRQAVFAVAWRMTYEASRAEDFTQEVFLRLWRKLDQFDTTRPLGPWLMTLATRTCINLVKKKRLPTVSIHGEPDEADWREPPDEAPRADEVVEKAEMLERLEAAIAELPETYRVAVTLRHVHGLSYKEIARALACPLGTVKVRLHRARERLAALVTPLTGDES